MLDALASFVDRIEYDFFINLSDADLALRTNEEMVRFFGRFKERNFMLVSHADASPFRKYMHDVLGKYVAIECGGFGFATVNTTAMRITPARPCCFAVGAGRRPDIVRAAADGAERTALQRFTVGGTVGRLLLVPDKAPRSAPMDENLRAAAAARRGVPRDHRNALLLPPRRRRAQPALPRLAARQVRRPEPPWAQLGWHTLGGPMLLNASTTSVVGPAITARKFDPGHDPVLTLKWDAWMARKPGEAAPGQSAIAEGLVARDPQLRLSCPSDAVLAVFHVPLETVPVSRTRRRRVSALHFDDGSSCSCAAGCAGDVSCKRPRRWPRRNVPPADGCPSWDARRRRCVGARRRRRASRRPVAARPSD